MNVITRDALAQLSDADLSALFARIVRELSDARPQTPEWRERMISLDNIRAEQATRYTILRPRPQRPRGPGF